jgi:hypothetical protein
MWRLLVVIPPNAIHVPRRKNALLQGNQKTNCAIAARSESDRAIFARLTPPRLNPHQFSDSPILLNTLAIWCG